MIRLGPLALGALLLAAPGPASAYDFAWSGKIELEAAGLKDPDPARRAAAVHQLGQYETDAVKRYLLEALEDGDRTVRQAAGKILAERKVAEAARIVIEWLNDPDSAIKKVAADILSDIGTTEAVGALIRTLGDVDPDVRLRAVLALGKIGTPAVVVPLVGRLEDDKNDVRRVAIEQLQEIGDRRAVIPVVGAFNDPAVDVRAAAVAAVGRLGDLSAVPALLRQIDDGVDKISYNAVSSLGDLGAFQAVDVLIDRMKRVGTDSQLRARAATALGKIVATEPPPGDRAAVAARARAANALVAALAEPGMQTHAHEGLRIAGVAAAPALVAHLAGEIDGDPETAVRLLRELPYPPATAVLIDELDRGRISQPLVLDALSRTGDKRALVPILGLLSAEDAGARLRAMRALRPLLEPSDRAADVIARHLGDDSFEVRVLAAEYLGLMRAKAAVPALVKLSGPGNELALRAAAIAALGEIADQRGAAPLLAVLRDGPESLQAAAASALIYIADPATVTPLLALVAQRGDDARAQIVRVVGGVLRDRPEPAARQALEKLARDGRLEVAIAAIAGLGAMKDRAARDTLARLARSQEPHRRRAALQALGAIGDPEDSGLLLDALRANDDRVSGAAAWSLARVGTGPAVVKALIEVARDRGWSTAINSTAALAELAAREPDAVRAHEEALLKLLHHRHRFVRANAAETLGRLGAAAGQKRLLSVLRDDSSRTARTAAARALSRVPGADQGAVRKALETAAKDDADEGVRQAAAATTPFAPAGRTDWRNFYFVDPDSGDAPVEQEPYFLITADGLVTTLYTDPRGEAVDEHFPPGAYVIAPRTSEAQY